VLYLDEGRTRYLGDVEGFLEIADPAAVKLPFEVAFRRYKAAGVASRGRAAGASRGRVPDEPLDGVLRDGAPVAADPDAAAPSPEAEEGPPRLEFRGVRAGYRNGEVLHGVDARLGRREVVAVLGPNGSGKTTLFRTAMRLLEPDAGVVLVDGESIASRTVASLATTFGYVFQSPSQMLFARTVKEELVFGPRNLGRDAETFDAIVADALRRTGLDALEDIEARPPLTLSFGQQKRLALAIALSLQPKTLILDEPSAGQDHRTAASFMQEVLAIPGLESVYLITHDVDLALTHADRILLFRAGEIVADGRPTQVIEDEDRWISCNLRITSLMRANARWRGSEGRFLDAEALANAAN
jgi:energy-coupling factor transporter ATP-binding protein EcfA2